MPINEFKPRDLPRTVLDDVKRALGKLHDAQLVYGDMRRPNIMSVKPPKSRL
jgi:tRNA A-37 threonylcarbamoyl transferase component Bud32